VEESALVIPGRVPNMRSPWCFREIFVSSGGVMGSGGSCVVTKWCWRTASTEVGG